jgi:acyl-CoA hydrolase
MSDDHRSFTPVDPASTATEMTWIVMPGQANALGTVFGGQIMAWIDVCAAVSAQRLSHSDVVTVGMDELTFEAPIKQGHIVVLRSLVNWVGSTSMEVGVRVESEDPRTGVRRKTSTAYLTFVAVDADGARLRLPPLVLTTPEQERRFADACRRRDQRLASRQQRGGVR